MAVAAATDWRYVETAAPQGRLCPGDHYVDPIRVDCLDHRVSPVASQTIRSSWPPMLTCVNLEPRKPIGQPRVEETSAAWRVRNDAKEQLCSEWSCRRSPGLGNVRLGVWNRTAELTFDAAEQLRKPRVLECARCVEQAANQPAASSLWPYRTIPAAVSMLS